MIGSVISAPYDFRQLFDNFLSVFECRAMAVGVQGGVFHFSQRIAPDRFVWRGSCWFPSSRGCNNVVRLPEATAMDANGMAKIPMFEVLKNSARKNTGVWLMALVLAAAIYSHYRTSQELWEVCGLASSLTRDHFDSEDLDKPHSFLDTEALRRDVERHGRLMSEDSREGREYRWRYLALRNLEKRCSDFEFRVQPSR